MKSPSLSSYSSVKSRCSVANKVDLGFDESDSKNLTISQRNIQTNDIIINDHGSKRFFHLSRVAVISPCFSTLTNLEPDFGGEGSTRI